MASKKTTKRKTSKIRRPSSKQERKNKRKAIKNTSKTTKATKKLTKTSSKLEPVKNSTIEIKLNIERYDPEDGKPKSEFIVNIEENRSLLEALEDVKENQDSSLCFSSGCKSGNCGSCGVMINNQPKLSCQTRIKDQVEKFGKEIKVEPMRNFDVFRDLIVDMGELFDSIDKVDPYLQEDTKSKEKLVPDRDQLEDLKSTTDCNLCGLCNSSCDVIRHSKKFIGPAAYVIAYRFVADPRDSKQKERLKNLVKNGLWSCAHDNSCNYFCPQDVGPAHAIADLRNFALDHEIHGDSGVKTVKQYIDSIKKSGMPYGSQISVKGKALPNHGKTFKFDDLKIIFKEIEREREKFQSKNLNTKKKHGAFRLD